MTQIPVFAAPAGASPLEELSRRAGARRLRI